jgi:hypothetical protein
MKISCVVLLAALGFAACPSPSGSGSSRPPAAPAKPSLKPTDNEIAVSWTAVESAASYEVWYGKTDKTGDALKLDGDANETNAAITGLESGAIYFVWVRAKNSHGTSGFSPYALGACVPDSGTISVNFDAASDSLKSESEDVVLSKSNASQRTAKFKAASGYQAYWWILDDDQTIGVSSELTLDASKFEKGAHTLVLFVTQENIPYSSSAIKITIGN